MLTRLLVFLCDVSPFLRRILWRWWYSRLARRIGTHRWTLMNYGYAPAAQDSPFPLEEADEADRLCLQLYERVARPADLTGKQVLEVGSGRGGGASFVARYRKPARMIGVDYSAKAVGFCRERHGGVQNLDFRVGDAEKLPFEDGTFDAVINVESSHCYGHVERFFAEVHRVLRPGGWFLFADLREAKDALRLAEQLRALPWTLVESEEITADVIRSLEIDDTRKRAMIEELVPPMERDRFGEFAGLTGGKIHQNLTKGDLVYWRYAMQKRADR